VPIPRRFDRRPPERDSTRINERIRVPKVRLIGADGEQVGIVNTDDARQMAREADLDLVEVAPGAKPPVARLLDYSKYKYEQDQKAKAARKHQTQVNVREIKLRPKIADNDYNTKKGHVTRFLKGGDKVKVTIMFRGREQAHPDRGRDLLQRLYEDLDGLAVIESKPLQEGRNMSMLLGPSKEATREASQEAKKAEPKAETKPKEKAEPEAEAKPKAESEAEPKAEAKPKEKAEPKAEAKPKAESEAKPKAKAKT
jgi:translation initiation factor IF-3